MSPLFSTWLLSAVVSAATPQPLTVDSFFQVEWLRNAAISPDGKNAAITIAKHDEAANNTPSGIYLFDIAGQQARELTAKGSSQPAWAPDSQNLYYIADGSSLSESQLWSIDITTGKKTELTNFCAGVNSPVVSPSGRYVALYSDLYPSCGTDLDCSCKILAEKALSKASGQLYDSSLFVF